MAGLTLISEHACYGGVQRFYEHVSSETGGPMRFSAYLPPQAAERRLPVLYFLSGLTCSEETFAIKSHAQSIASELGIILIGPDTSPREPRIPGDAESWDFGYSAGFYLDATRLPWAANYRMYSYVTRELYALVAATLPQRENSVGIMGHSMGGHGALVCALRNPQKYKSVSAFAPIAAPSRCPWGQKAFTNYLGEDRTSWQDYDASQLVVSERFPRQILIDQGTADKFLDEQLQPQVFAHAARSAGQELNLRMQNGYDHGYYFIQTFIPDHLRHHAKFLLP